MERHWLIYDGTGSAEGGTVRYLVALDQCRMVLVIYDAAVSLQGGTGWYLMELGQ